MPQKVDLNNLPPFPKRLPEKLKTIRARLGLTHDEIAPMVGARTGAEILVLRKRDPLDCSTVLPASFRE